MKVKEYSGKTRLSLKGKNPVDHYSLQHQLMDVLNDCCPTAQVTEYARKLLAAVGWNLIPPLR